MAAPPKCLGVVPGAALRVQLCPERAGVPLVAFETGELSDQAGSALGSLLELLSTSSVYTDNLVQMGW